MGKRQKAVLDVESGPKLLLDALRRKGIKTLSDLKKKVDSHARSCCELPGDAQSSSSQSHSRLGESTKREPSLDSASARAFISKLAIPDGHGCDGIVHAVQRLHLASSADDAALALNPTTADEDAL